MLYLTSQLAQTEWNACFFYYSIINVVYLHW